MNASRHDPPNAPTDLHTGFVNRPQRNELATVVRQFLNEELTAFEFDDRLDAFRDASDSAVRFVAQAVWFHYDDCDDHLAALSKSEWDYFQRLLLLLESNCLVQTASVRRWSLSQLIAFLSLLGFLYVAFHVGWANHLLLAAVPFWIVSLGISYLRSTASNAGPFDLSLYPFASLRDLKATYVKVAFKKERYPQQIKSRRVHTPFMSAVYQFQFYVAWLMLSPVVLAFQAIPPSETSTRVIVA